MKWRNPKPGRGSDKVPGLKWRKPSQVTTLWIGKANMYLTKDKEHIASITMSAIGYVVAWNEFVPQKIRQRMQSIWSSYEAAELIILAAHAEALHDRQAKSGGRAEPPNVG